MPKFLDSHSLKGVDPKVLKELQSAPQDEFGVTHLNIMWNEKEDKCYCLLEAPNKEAVEKHHNKNGYTCDNILEVGTSADPGD